LAGVSLYSACFVYFVYSLLLLGALTADFLPLCFAWFVSQFRFGSPAVHLVARHGATFSGLVRLAALCGRQVVAL